MLNANAVSVQSNLGCGKLDHLCLALKPEIYTILSEVDVQVFVNLEQQPVFHKKSPPHK